MAMASSDKCPPVGEGILWRTFIATPVPSLKVLATVMRAYGSVRPESICWWSNHFKLINSTNELLQTVSTYATACAHCPLPRHLGRVPAGCRNWCNAGTDAVFLVAFPGKNVPCVCRALGCRISVLFFANLLHICCFITGSFGEVVRCFFL